MNGQDYTPEDALKSLMARLRKEDDALAAEIQVAIDQGRDIQQTEPARGSKKARRYRKTVPYSPEEALHVAIRALMAYFVEQPLFMNSCHDNLAKAAVGEPRRERHYWEKDSPFPVNMETEGRHKDVEIELVTETQLPSDSTALQLYQETQTIQEIQSEKIREQQRNIALVSDLVTFERH